jgi:hypothetical protein
MSPLKYCLNEMAMAHCSHSRRVNNCTISYAFIDAYQCSSSAAADNGIELLALPVVCIGAGASVSGTSLCDATTLAVAGFTFRRPRAFPPAPPSARIEKTHAARAAKQSSGNYCEYDEQNRMLCKAPAATQCRHCWRRATPQGAGYGSQKSQ